MRDLFNLLISKGSVHNIVYKTLEQVTRLNQEQGLSLVKVGVHDKIFQAGSPVLVGCEAWSTYCYLLSQEDRRDGNTWGVHLLDLSERHNLKPEHTVADAGQGLRKGQQEAWPPVPCWGDVFHVLKPFQELIRYLENRA